MTGAVRKISEREAIIDEFNASADIPVLFLTTGVGGVGITLTGADRVILFDPSWNPATDAQAVDRAYRVGQTRPVIVYRLVTCGTVRSADGGGKQLLPMSQTVAGASSLVPRPPTIFRTRREHAASCVTIDSRE